MASLKNLSIRRLRALARKHLGPGASPLQTKEQLLAALKRFVPAIVRGGPKKVVKRTLGKASKQPAPPDAPMEPRAVESATEPALRREEREHREEAQPGGSPLKSGMVIEASAPTPRPRADVTRPSDTGMIFGRVYADEGLATAGRSNGNGRRPGRPIPAEPLVEGFFVARVAGEQEARRHHLTEDQVRPPAEHGVGLRYEEQLPEIPWEYQDDRVVLMARDPSTLFAYWDFHPETRRAAFEGLEQPRAVMRVLENGHEVRVLDLALESRSFYVHGLRAGRPYRVELHAVGRDGVSRRIGPASNDMTLPSDDVSSNTSVRYLRVPWGVPLNRLRESLDAGEVESRDVPEPPEPLAIMHSRWVPLPNSGSWQLERWIERVPGQAPGSGAPAGSLPHLELAPSPIGGASSWTVVSSWWSAPNSASGAGPSSSDRDREG
jgi:hypothetical protein